MADSPIIVWFRNDLRLSDNPALDAAVERGGPIIPIYIWSPDEEADWQLGGASKVWLHYSLQSLNEALEASNSRLLIRSGQSLPIIQEMIQETNAQAVYWNRRYEPYSIQRDSIVKSELKKQNIDAKSFNGSLLFEPWEIQTKQEQPYKVFTPFWKTCTSLPEPDEPTSAAHKIQSIKHWPKSQKLETLNLLPKIQWHNGILNSWSIGEAAAKKQLRHFISEAMSEYSVGRDIPGKPLTSRMSPYLHFGEISPRQIWHEVVFALSNNDTGNDSTSAWAFLREVGWREFAYHLMYHFPHTTTDPLREKFSRFPWKSNPRFLQAWQKGETGLPIIDAGMRELWATGWMHNRVRMVVASLLVKNMLVPWQEGARWFWDTLVDADLASNTFGWQWTAGCGADAAPFFRIFNPIAQGEKFDGDGEYVRKWVPEINNLPDKWIHKPWEAPATILNDAGVTLGKNYPYPVVDLKITRQDALEAYQTLKRMK
ncbi:MAG: deoxyribodipyrimidine photo-lyase [Candidatus Hinthialibacter antarcticus]|nr:deoxyribodipyrimidine photo-lyase [Candidatus Hinthialibacter antarcticus]